MQPVSNPINFISLALQTVFLFVLYWGFQQSGSDEAALWAAMIYLMFAYGLRYFIPIEHRKGMRELKQGNYAEAFIHFEKSFEYFSAHVWIDRFRVFTTFSVTKLSYRELALVYKTHCLECLKRVDDA